MGVWIVTMLSVLVVSLISFVGALTMTVRPDRMRKILLYMVSFAAGALLGDAFIHLLPEATEAGFGINISIYVLAGIATSFIVEKSVHLRHHHNGVDASHHYAQEGDANPFAILNLFGEAIHNFVDGIIIGASYLVSIPVGIATTLAVIFHEIPSELGDFGVLLHGGYHPRKALLYNFAVALTAFLGAAAALIAGVYIENAVQILVPFAAGTFIYIAGADLIPELHKETNPKKSFLQFIAFVIGMLVMASLILLE